MALKIVDGAGRPYVHSSIYNVHRTIKQSFTPSRNDGIELFEGKIRYLTKIRDYLYNEAQFVLGGRSPEDFSKEMLTKPDKYRAIASKVLTDSKFIAILNKDPITYDRDKFLKSLKKEVRDKVVRQLNEDQKVITQNELYVLMREHMKIDDLIDNKYGSSAIQLQNMQSALIGKAKANLRADYKRYMYRWADPMKRVIRAAFEDATIPVNPEPEVRIKEAYEYFEQQFRAIATNEDLFDQAYLKKESIDDYLRLTKEDLIAAITKEYENIQKLKGDLGETWRAVFHNREKDRPDGIEMVSVGSFTEKDLRSRLNQIQAPATFRDTSKFSYSDLLLVKDGRTFRVQAKNYQAVFKEILDTGRSVPIRAGLTKDKNFYEFLELLSSRTPIMDEEDIAAMSYLIANELWFNKVGSIQDQIGTRRKFRKTGAEAGLEIIRTATNRLLSSAALDFLGIVYDENITINESMALSNIFYLASNVVLIPTYAIIDGILAWFQDVGEELATLSVTIQDRGNNTSWAWKDRYEFWNYKTWNIQPGPFLSLYIDPRLLETGYSQGASVMEGLVISRVNLNLNLDTLMNSYMDMTLWIGKEKRSGRT